MLMTHQTPRALKIAATIIALGFLAFGLLRIFAGGAILGMDAGLWTLGGDFAEGLSDAHRFHAELEHQALVPWSVTFYFVLILTMGLLLTAGSALYLAKRFRVGLVLIGIYLAMHGGMFLNYQVINPKIILWGVTVALWGVLWWRARR